MPNISNKDVESSIVNCAKDLFIQRGYEKVDMKLIAKKCNLPIGTVFNYFPNKSKIFIKLLEDSWNYTFNKIKKLNSLDTNSRMDKLIEILYDDMCSRKAFNTESINLDLLEKQNDYVINSIAHIINSFEHNPKDIVNYLYSTTFVKAILDYINELIINSHSSRKENLNLLSILVDKLMSNKF
ncbi:TetR/AcrR family transcriptional regulator [Clostridium sp. CTA-19]